jgi:hypothetical protein
MIRVRKNARLLWVTWLSVPASLCCFSLRHFSSLNLATTHSQPTQVNVAHAFQGLESIPALNLGNISISFSYDAMTTWLDILVFATLKTCNPLTLKVTLHQTLTSHPLSYTLTTLWSHSSSVSRVAIAGGSSSTLGVSIIYTLEATCGRYLPVLSCPETAKQVAPWNSSLVTWRFAR